MRLPWPKDDDAGRISPEEPMPTASYEQAREWMLRQGRAAVEEIAEEIEKREVLLALIGRTISLDEREAIEEDLKNLRVAQDAALDAYQLLRTQYGAASGEEGCGDAPSPLP